ncbi:MAG: D-aminoacylase [Candidatus Sumerlaeaceae bacterium]|nr:D-aminoacylase [Candidatus Sumerlaeaceae bacterium]
MFDLIIYNAKIVDGRGVSPFVGHVAIKDDEIVEIIPASTPEFPLPSSTRKAIDATGLIMTPGFIDVHGHSDLNILACPEMESKLRQGITTEIIGNCGESAFPLFGAFRQSTREELRRLDLEPRWNSAEQYFTCLEAIKPACNIASCVGHGSVRAAVMGYGDNEPTNAELGQMKREIALALQAGAIGMSTGLIYPPGIFSTVDEIAQLQCTAREYGGIYSSHIRSEGDLLLQAANEFIEIIGKTGSQGQFSHLKASGRRNWGKVQLVIDTIEEAITRGANIWWDKYPYIASSTSLASLLPKWVLAGGRDAAIERLRDKSTQLEIIAEAERANEGCDGWESVLVVDAACDEYTELQGFSIGEAARRKKVEAGELFLSLLVASELRAAICNFTMNWQETDLAILHARGMVCTDAACRAPKGVLSHDSPHPRAYGTFGAFFRRYVKEKRLLSLEEAVRKVTSFPCEVFGIKKRGRIQKGYFADLLLIEWDSFRDASDFSAPHRFCEGLRTVVVNGKITFHDGAYTGLRGGRVLRRCKDGIA